MKLINQKVAKLTLAALALGLSSSASAALWQFQFTGVDAVYDPSQTYTNLGVDTPIAGDFATLRDQNVNGDQSFGNFAEGDELNRVEILKDGVFYGSISDNIAVDFRLVLRKGTKKNAASDPLDWSKNADFARIDTKRSFFDLYFDTEPGSAWGIALDTSTDVVQKIAQVNDQIVIGGLIGEIFGAPGSFDLPAFTDEGVSMSMIGLPKEGDTFAFSFSLGNLDFENPNDKNNSMVTMSGTGEVGFEAPEPGALILLGLGLIGLAGLRRRK